MTDLAPDPETRLAEEPRLLTLDQAAEVTGLSRKAITGRLDRGTLQSVNNSDGHRRVPRAELQRAGLIAPGDPGESDDQPQGTPPSRDLVRWEDLYEREYAAREREYAARADAEATAAALREQLTAIANAGPIRAMRLRRALRAGSLGDAAPDRPADG
jgi:hypothetical protein